MSNKNRLQPVFKPTRTDIVTDQQSLPPQEQNKPPVPDADDSSLNQAADALKPEAAVAEPVVEDETASAAESAQPKPEETLSAPVTVSEWTRPASQPNPQWSKAVKSVLSQLVTYHETMDPKRAVSPEEGGRAQYSMLMLMRSILGQQDAEVFKTQWHTLLSYFDKFKKELFNENQMFRFPDNFAGSDLELAIWRRLVWVAIVSSDPATRRVNMLKVKLETVRSGLNDTESTNLINFYS